MSEFTRNFFNSHYIRVDTRNRIFAGFSDAFRRPEPVLPLESRVKHLEEAIEVIADTLRSR